jgi:ribosome-binding factor A
MAEIALKRLASQIRLVVSDALQNRLADPRLERIASITRVEVTADLSFADVCISVMGTEGQQRGFMSAMNSAHGKIQRLVAKNLRTRICPILRFHLDESLKRGFETIQLIDKAMAEDAQRPADHEPSNQTQSEDEQ